MILLVRFFTPPPPPTTALLVKKKAYSKIVGWLAKLFKIFLHKHDGTELYKMHLNKGDPLSSNAKYNNVCLEMGSESTDQLCV